MGRQAKGENSNDIFIGIRERVLLALKPCSMDSCQLYECIPGASKVICDLLNEGLIERSGRGVDAVYWLTESGRRAVPKRRDILHPVWELEYDCAKA